jgi:hypothetical protein
MKRNRCAALALALFACVSLFLLMPAHAQSVYGSIFGTISDKTGAAIPGATPFPVPRFQSRTKPRARSLLLPPTKRATTRSPT